MDHEKFGILSMVSVALFVCKSLDSCYTLADFKCDNQKYSKGDIRIITWVYDGLDITTQSRLQVADASR